MRYQNFDIEIEGDERGRYAVHAEWRSARPRPDQILIDQELRELQLQIASNHGVDATLMSDFGKRLYRLLLGGEAGSLFHQSVGYARALDQGVCLRLCIESADAASLPWELIYWPEEEILLAGSREFPLVRYVRLARPLEEFKIGLPLRMLVAIPSLSGLDTEKEESNLRSAVRGLESEGLLELQVLKGNVNLSAVSDAFLKTPFHVFHFIGHGEFADKTAYLKFNSEDGGWSSVDDLQICTLLREQRSLKLVFLNACRGAATSAEDVRTGMAPRLVRAGVPAVIAMQYEIQDEAAIAFSREFYSSLFLGSDRGRVDVAMCRGRNLLQREFSGERDICAPVLFMRAPEGVLFDSEAGAGRTPALIPGREQGRLEAVAKTLTQNILRREAEPGGDDAGLRADRTQLGLLQASFRRSNLGWAALAGLILVAWLALGLSDRINFDVDTYVMSIGDALVPAALHEDVVLVAVDEGTQKHFNRRFLGQNWRPNHAVLIKRLAEAKARVIAFDIAFEPAREGDAAFIEAIRQAEAAGTAVVVASGSFDGGKPVMAPGLGEAITSWGYGCYQKNPFGYANTVSLASKAKNGGGLRPQLALAAFAPRHRIADIDFENRTISLVDRADASLKKVRFTAASLASSSGGKCPAISEGDSVADFIVDAPPLATLRDPAHRVPYQNIADPASRIDLSRFANKTVLVAFENDQRTIATKTATKDEHRYGLEVHAGVLSMLMRGAAVDRVGPGIQIALALGVALVAGFCRMLLPGKRNRVFAVLPDALVLLTLAAVCLVLACVTFLEWHSLLNYAHCFFACVISYFIIGFVRAQWMSTAGGQTPGSA